MVELTTQNGSVKGGAWSWDVALRGVIPPMISPLDEAGQVDVAQFHVSSLIWGGTVRSVPAAAADLIACQVIGSGKDEGRD